MAPIVEPELVLIFPWPFFQAVIDGQSAIGAKLYTYAPATSTPKAAYSDPFSTTPQTNPIVLDDQGAATIYLDGNYDLRLYDVDDVLIWSVDNYAFSSGVVPSPGLVQVGSAEATLQAIDGAAVLTAQGLAPTGYRLLGLTTEILQDFGTSRGLTGLLYGDAVLNDRWGLQTTLVAGTVTRERAWHSDTQILTAQPYTFLAAARGGLFDSQGQLRVRATWQLLGTTVDPDADPTAVTYGSAEATLTATDGAAVLTAAGLAPADCRVLGLTTEVVTSFGTSRGLTGLVLGDGTLSDRWGLQTTLVAGTISGQQLFHSDTEIIAPAGYTVLVAANGGRFDAQGSLHVTLFWQTLTPVSP